jgi:holo-[acyl-carrier protein] synthase
MQEQYSMTKIRSGIDLVKVSRLEKAYEIFGLRFLNRIYDNLEIEQFQKKSTRAKPFFLAKNFAGKEAVSKIIGYGFTNGVRPKDIVILRKYGGPIVKLNGKAKLLAEEQGLDEISLSLSDTDEHATAMAVAITE